MKLMQVILLFSKGPKTTQGKGSIERGKTDGANTVDRNACN
jgi:hypothetical protein